MNKMKICKMKTFVSIMFFAIFVNVSVETMYAQGGQPMWKLDGNSVATGKFLGTTNNEPLIFKSNNTEGFRLLPDGSIGIGTTAPQAKLDVNGDVVVRGWLWAQDGVVVGKRFQGGKADVDTMRAHQTESDRIMSHFVYIDGSISRISSTSGFIDFNNTSLTNINTVHAQNFSSGNVVFDELRVINKLMVGNSTLIFENSNENHVYTSETSGNLFLQSQNFDQNTILNYGNEGNVGIGTDNPGKKLHVKHDKSMSQIVDPIADLYSANSINPKEAQTATAESSQRELDSLVAETYYPGSLRLETSIIETGVSSSWDLQPLAPILPGQPYRLSFSDAVHNKTIMTLTSDGSDGKLGIGVLSPRQRIQVHNGSILVSGQHSGIFFHQHNSNWPKEIDSKNYFSFQNHGNYGIEYLPPEVIGDHYGGLNFWTPWGNTYDGETKNFIMLLADNGNVGIGTGKPEYSLDVCGNIRATDEIFIDANGNCWPDFVFNSNHFLEPFELRIETIKQQKHLPNVPSEKEVTERGIPVTETVSGILQNVEELYLYMEQMEIRLKQLEEENRQLRQLLNQ